MAVPWLRILDTLIGVADLAASRRSRREAEPEAQRGLTGAAGGAPGLGGLEARLAGVMVAALKEVFERDTRRLEFEREQVEAERARAERALRLELRRQAVDREIGRLRLTAGIAVASWLGTLLLAGRLAGGGIGPRVLVGCGWALLIAALSAAFIGQSALSRAANEPDRGDAAPASSGPAGLLAAWLIVGGLALVAVAVLILP
jgi:hypothetical protein